MRLHRTEVPDWSKLPPTQHNWWQRLAARTHGIITPGNAVSLFGASLVIYGLYLLSNESLAAGATALGAGRLADVADGWVAERTKTRSPLGEAVDASVDKVLIGVAVLMLLYLQLLPPLVGIILILHGAYNSLLVIPAERVGVKLHPSQTGKLATFFAWSSVVLWVIDQHLSALICFGLFIILAALSSLNYTKQVISVKKR